MIVLDTNVVSELMRPAPHPAVLVWVDAQIAATCLAHGAQLATRNVRHFEGLGLAWVNPWLA